MRLHRRQPIRLHRPWDSPGKNTGVGCHFLLQCMKVKSQRTGNPANRESRSELIGQGESIRTERLPVLPSTHCLFSFTPHDFLKAWSTPKPQTNIQLSNFSSLSLCGGWGLIPPDPSLVGPTLALLVESARRPPAPSLHFDLIWQVCEPWLLCPLQEFSKQEELISSVSHSQQLPHLDQG